MTMKAIAFLLLLCLSAAVYAGTRDRGIVNFIYPSQNKIYFTLTEDPVDNSDFDCLGTSAYRYYIIVDDTSSNITSHTTSYFYYSLLMYSMQFKKTIELDLSTSVCASPNQVTAHTPVNYMFISW